MKKVVLSVLGEKYAQIKCLNNEFILASQGVWSHVDYLRIIIMFLSAVWTLILTAPIHCRGSTGEQVM